MNDSFNDYGTVGSSPSPENGAVELEWDAFTADDEKRAKKTFSRYFLGLTLFNVASAAFIYALTFLVLRPLGLIDHPFVQSKLFLWLVEQVFAMYVIGFGVYFLTVRKMRITPRAKSPLSAKEFLIFFCIANACMTVGAVLGNYLNGLIERFCGWEITNEVSDLIADTDFLIALPIVGIIGPFVEEILFRKAMIDRLSVYGDKIAIVVSAVAFGLFHGNFYQLFYAALLGLVLGYIYTKTGNVLYTFAIHALINSISTLSGLLLPLEEKYLEISEQLLENPGMQLPPEFTLYSLIMSGYSLYTYGIAIAGIVLFFKLRRKVFISDRCEVMIPKERRASVVCLNGGVIFFLLFSAAEFLLSIFNGFFGT